VEFCWDKKKARSNLSKHGVSFEEAQTCFYDPLHIVLVDEANSCLEGPRLLLLGLSAQNNTLVVVHIEYEIEEEVRIISARKATKSERKQYEELP